MGSSESESETSCAEALSPVRLASSGGSSGGSSFRLSTVRGALVDTVDTCARVTVQLAYAYCQLRRHDAACSMQNTEQSNAANSARAYAPEGASGQLGLIFALEERHVLQKRLRASVVVYLRAVDLRRARLRVLLLRATLCSRRRRRRAAFESEPVVALRRLVLLRFHPMQVVVVLNEWVLHVKLQQLHPNDPVALRLRHVVKLALLWCALRLLPREARTQILGADALCSALLEREDWSVREQRHWRQRQRHHWWRHRKPLLGGERHAGQ